VSQFGFSVRRTTLLGMVDGAVESVHSFGFMFVFATLNLCRFISLALKVVTIWFGVSIVPFVGRAYAGVIAFIPATVGAILVNALPSHNKVGLLCSYWVSSKFLFTFKVLDHDDVQTVFAITPFAIFLGWVESITAGHTKSNQSIYSSNVSADASCMFFRDDHQCDRLVWLRDW
jgi:MFS transporter, ACS family, allantoate permease